MTTEYMLPRTAEEYERLREQARMWEAGTSALLDRVGLGVHAIAGLQAAGHRQCRFESLDVEADAIPSGPASRAARSFRAHTSHCGHR